MSGERCLCFNIVFSLLVSIHSILLLKGIFFLSFVDLVFLHVAGYG